MNQPAAVPVGDQLELFRMRNVATVKALPCLIPGGRALDEEHAFASERIVREYYGRYAQSPAHRAYQLRMVVGTWIDQQRRRMVP